ncbi:hypothetical protein [Lactococcus lactis]|uniref:hypothetical protein n=1 Tax=Lactococcus lactis TaxID=1358 RepID=UPI0023A97539|nr:hypothetical protein [Lactococcus lactis]WEA55064.1 hypothetical protein PWP91_12425 [Lactococcus lactis]
MSNIPEFEMNDPLFHFYNKKDVEAFRALVDKERIFSQKFIDGQAEKGLSPELAGVLAGIGTGAAALGIAVPVATGMVAAAVGAEGVTVGATFAGLTAAGTATTLAAAGGGTVAAGGAGMAGGAAAIAEGGAAAGAAVGIGGAALVAGAVLIPAVLAGGLIWGVRDQGKMKSTLINLIGLSYEYEEILKLDRREEVIDLLAYVRVARDKYIK